MSEPTQMADESLDRARYASLATYRRTGVAVATQVWIASEQGDYYVFSAANAGKVKRLRNSSRASLAVCDARGKLLGDRHDATALIITDDDEIQRALRLLHRKYGWQMWLADAGSKLTGRYHRRAYIRVRLV
jgi:uncharacterized protein